MENYEKTGSYHLSEKEIQLITNALNNDIIQAKSDIKLKKAYNNKLLFVLGINLGISTDDFRKLKWDFFFDENYNFKEFYFICNKSNKKIKLYFNEDIKCVISEYIEKYPISDYEEYIFVSKNNNPITVQNMWLILKNISNKAKIDRNIGICSLKKTWGYNCLNNAKDKYKALIILQNCFNHPSTRYTLKYIGVNKNN